MTTIMTVGNSHGQQRCDDVCHGATEPKCVCICGGRYHGRGAEALDLLAQDLVDGEWGDEWKRTDGFLERKVATKVTAKQLVKARTQLKSRSRRDVATELGLTVYRLDQLLKEGRWA